MIVPTKLAFFKPAIIASSLLMSSLSANVAADSLKCMQSMLAEDWPSAFASCEQAAIKGFASSQNSLGELYIDGLGVVADPAKAYEWWGQAAEKGNVAAMAHLGVLYADGIHVAQDYAKALAYFDQASAKKIPLALYRMGLMYDRGLGVDADVEAALGWYIQAASKGNIESFFALGDIYAEEGEYRSALRWFNEAARSGVEEAKFNIAALEQLRNPEKLDLAKAQALNAVYVKRQDRLAMYNEGLLLDKAGTPDKRMPLLKRALSFYERAAKAGVTKAQTNAGLMLVLGEAGDADILEGTAWLLVAKQGGDAEAANAIKVMSRILTPQQMAQAQNRAKQLV